MAQGIDSKKNQEKLLKARVELEEKRMKAASKKAANKRNLRSNRIDLGKRGEGGTLVDRKIPTKKGTSVGRRVKPHVDATKNVKNAIKKKKASKALIKRVSERQLIKQPKRDLIPHVSERGLVKSPTRELVKSPTRELVKSPPRNLVPFGKKAAKKTAKNVFKNIFRGMGPLSMLIQDNVGEGSDRNPEYLGKQAMDIVKDYDPSKPSSPQEQAEWSRKNASRPPSLTKKDSTTGNTVLNLSSLASQGTGDVLKRQEDADELARLVGEEANSRISGNRASQLEDVNDFEKLLAGAPVIPEDSSPIDAPLPEEDGEKVSDVIPQEIVERVKKATEEAADKGSLTRDASPLSNLTKPEDRSVLGSQFMDAVTFFLPTVLGALGGALIEGSEGAIAGAEEATKLSDSYRKHKMAQSTLAQKNAPKPLTAYQKETLARRDKGLSQKDQDLHNQSRRINQTERKNKLNEMEKSQLSEAQVKESADITRVQTSIDNINALLDKKDVETGILIGRYQNFAQLTGQSKKSFDLLKSHTGFALASYVKSISGAAVSEPENKRLASLIPNVNDNPQVFQSKLQVFQQIINDNKTAFESAIRKGQPLRAKALEGLFETEFRKQRISTKGFTRDTSGGQSGTYRPLNNPKDEAERVRLRKQNPNN